MTRYGKASCDGITVPTQSRGVTRAAAVPRLLPRDLTLVKANGRVSLAGIIGASVSAPLAALASLAGSEWSLRYAFLLFVLATICAIRLPASVDSSEGEGEMTFRKSRNASGPSRRGRLRTHIPAPVAFALRANCGPWFMSGFLLMFVAFLLRNPEVRPDSAFGPAVTIGIVVGAAGLGRVLGTVAASTLRKLTPAVAVVIMLAVAGERCVLGRQARFAPGMWSCLAGFVEPGEAIEDAVRRETREEAGIVCGRVSYFASQPWPFPTSLMFGCHADAPPREIVIDRAELDDARWFDREEVASMLLRRHPDGLTTPPTMAIAYHIIRAWVEEEVEFR